MKIKILATAIFLLALACIGWSSEQKEIFEAYNSTIGMAENEDWAELFDNMSEETKLHLTNLAEVYTQAGVPFDNDGKEFLASIISNTNALSFSEAVISIEFRNGTAYLLAGEGSQIQSYQFEKEGADWKLNLTPILTDFINETMTGVPDTELGEITPTYITYGVGNCELHITNKLQNLSIWNVYCSRSDSDSWGEDLLNSSILGTDATLLLRLEAGIYDVKLFDADENSYTMWEIDLNENGVQWQVSEADKDELNE